MAELTVDHALEIVGHPSSKDDLVAYFANDIDSPAAYTGGWFESLDGGGDAPGHENTITMADLLAVECLSVHVPIRVGLSLLDGSVGELLADWLPKIPPEAVLGRGDARSHLDDGSPADQAWWCLVEQEGIGWVTAGKLLARKRSHLIPVWDQVVRCVCKPRRGENAWLWLDSLFREEGGTLPEALAAEREAAGLTERISILRTWDVIVWMRHHKDHRTGRCPGIAAG